MGPVRRLFRCQGATGRRPSKSADPISTLRPSVCKLESAIQYACLVRPKLAVTDLLPLADRDRRLFHPVSYFADAPIPESHLFIHRYIILELPSNM